MRRIGEDATGEHKKKEKESKKIQLDEEDGIGCKRIEKDVIG